MSDDEQSGFGGEDDDMPPEMREHMLAAFAHHAGLGPHPGKYKGPGRKQRDPDEISDTDRQRAEEEPLEGEASAAKMRAAQTGGSLNLGPSQMDQAQIKQRSALAQQSSTQSAAQAQQAQGSQTPVNAPPAPSGPQGATLPYQAQKGAVGGSGNVQQPSQAAAPPPAPGQGGPPPDQGEEEGPPPQ